MTRFRAKGWWLTAMVVSTLGLGCAREEARQSGAEGGAQPATVAETDAGSGAAEAGKSIGVMAPEDLAGLLGTASEPVILDVRSPEEYAAGHIPGAINIPYDQIAARLDTLEVFRDREVVVYCRSGRRAGVAEATLAEAGFQRLLDLEGHMQSWQAAEYPVAVPAADCC